jgi:hypothetical protein
MYRIGFCLLLTLLCVLPPPVPASWGGGFCGPVGPALAQAPLSYDWRPIDAEQSALFQGDVQVGVLVLATGDYYQRLAPGQFDGPCSCPTSLPPAAAKKPMPKAEGCPCCGEDCQCGVKPCGKPSCRCVLSAGTVEADGTPNFGLDLSQMPAPGKHILNGQEVTKEEMMQAIGKPQLPDDAEQMCVTVIGPDASRKQVMADLDTHPALSPWKGKVKVHGYDPSHWAVAQAGFLTTGSPTIYCQAADGQVLHRQDEYRGPEALAEALRRADPSYQPQKDPDLNKTFNLQATPMWVWIVGGIVLFLLLKGE